MKASAAITATLAEGISVNVTLIFSLERYRAVINAFQAGLEQAKDNGHDLARSTPWPPSSSPASTPKSTSVWTRIGTEKAKALKGKAGVANARLAYQVYEELFSTERWAVLAEAGALPQRPLWASTGVKDPAYPGTLYVTELVAAGVVNTMPEKTLDATFDHGVVTGDTITGTYTDANATLGALEKLRHPLQRSCRAPGIRRPGQVRGQLEGTPGRRRRRPRRCTEGFLTHYEHSQLRRHRCRAAGTRAAPAHPRCGPHRHPDLRQGPHPVGSRRRVRVCCPPGLGGGGQRLAGPGARDP